MAAVEERRFAKEELESAAPYLISGGTLDIEGFEDDVVRRGGYVGQRELALLVGDWARQFEEAKVKVSDDGRMLSVRGTPAMAGQISNLIALKDRTRAEIEPVVTALRNGIDLHLSLDQEWTRTGGPDLLTANHPLVLTATRVPGYRQVRHSTVRIASCGEVPAGNYLVQLSIADWFGVQPRTEVWTAVCDLGSGRPGPERVGDVLLARLADAGLKPGGPVTDLTGALTITEHQLREKQIAELALRSRDNEALMNARRISIREVHQRRREGIMQRKNTLEKRNRSRALISAAQTHYERDMIREEEALAKLIRPAVVTFSWPPWRGVCRGDGMSTNRRHKDHVDFEAAINRSYRKWFNEKSNPSARLKGNLSPDSVGLFGRIELAYEDPDIERPDFYIGSWYRGEEAQPWSTAGRPRGQQPSSRRRTRPRCGCDALWSPELARSMTSRTNGWSSGRGSLRLAQPAASCSQGTSSSADPQPHSRSSRTVAKR